MLLVLLFKPCVDVRMLSVLCTVGPCFTMALLHALDLLEPSPGSNFEPPITFSFFLLPSFILDLGLFSPNSKVSKHSVFLDPSENTPSCVQQGVSHKSLHYSAVSQWFRSLSYFYWQ